MFIIVFLVCIFGTGITAKVPAERCIAKSFTCSINGRYAVPGDTTCKHYYYCYELHNTGFTQTEYSCDPGLFNEDTQSCDLGYKCPCTPSSTTPGTITIPNDRNTTSSAATCNTNKPTTTTATRTPEVTTPAYCDSSNINKTFTCSANGRYPMPGDLSCLKYYYCFKLSSGSFSQTVYECAFGLFNESTQSCDKTYVCPCGNSSTSVASDTTSAMTGTTVQSTLTTTSRTTLSTSIATKSTSPGGSTGTTPVYCDARNANNTFTCLANGRYPMPGDTLCLKYYYCFKLSSGNFSQTLYECANGLFNGATQSCDKTYVCPCSSSTTSAPPDTTSAITGTTESTTPGGSTGTTPSTTLSTSTATESTTPGGSTGTTPVYCDAKNSNNTFTCLANGRYPMPGDTSCLKYFYCLKLSSGKFSQTLYECANGFFNGATQSCDKTYVCPCSNSSTSAPPDTTSAITGTTESTTPGGSTGTTPSTTLSTSTATESTTPGGSTGTTPVYCDAKNSNNTFTCLANGRYPMPGDTSCLKYFYCLKLSSGKFSQTLYECANGFFNGATQSCDKTYVCPCSSSSTSAPPDTTSAMTGTPESTTPGESTGTTPVYCDASNSNNTFTCLANGRYPMPGDTSCLKYFYCLKLSSGKFSQTLYECANGYFNGATQSCDKTYICPCSNSSTSAPPDATSAITGTTEYTSPGGSTGTTPSTTLSTSTATQSTTPGGSTGTTPVYCDPRNANNTFTCLANGRYPMPGDTSCLKYFYCLKLSSGKFSQTLYECANGFFSGATQSCDKTYVCPCSSSSTSAPPDTTSAMTSTTEQSTLPTTPSTTLSTSTATDSTTPGGSNGTTPVYCDANNSKNTFTCLANGRYPMPGDTSCLKYFYCLKLSSGKFSQTLYECANGFFNGATQSCDKTYVCPCSSSSTSAPPDTTSAMTSTTEQSTLPTTPSTTLSTSTATDSTTPGGSTGTTPVYCDANNSNNTFTCLANGRYPMPGDTSCLKYFYCLKLSSGKFSQTLYECANGFFNEATQSCDKTYICPCSSSSTSAPPDTTSAITDTTESTTPGGSTGTTPSTTLSTSTATESTTPGGSTGTTPVYCDAKNSNNTFTCLANGRYPMPGDTSCLKYFYCLKLSSGKFSQTLYECANGFFNGASQSCDKTYVCPCSNSSTSAPPDATSAITGTTESTTPGGSTGTTPSTTLSTSTATQSTTPGGSTGTTPVYCDPRNANNTFTCLANGRYPMPGDTSCLKYFYCLKLSSGKFSQTLYECANGFFNGATQSCDKTYVCPCSSSSTSAPPDTTSAMTSTTEQSTLPTTPSTTLSTSTATDSTTPGGSTGTTPVYCDANNSNNTFTCLANGRYPMPGDTSCLKYFYCLKLSSGKFSQTLYECANGFFNGATQSCDKTYICPCSSSSTSAPPDTTSAMTGTPESTNPGGSTGTTPSTTLSTSTATESTTPGGSTGTTPVYCDAKNSNNTFTCLANGRYPMPGDTSCLKYFYCLKLSSGKFSQTLYECANGFFSEATQSCDKTYVCPCSSNSTSAPPDTTSAITSTTESTTHGGSTGTTPSTTFSTSTATESTTPGGSTGTTPVYCDPRNANNTFNCLANGRYPMPGDISCLKYFYCLKLSSGKFSQTLYECANGFFNGASQSCDKAYVCPCSNRSTSAPPDTTSAMTSTTKQSTLPTTPSTTLSTSTATESTSAGGSTGTTPVYCDARNTNNSFTCLLNGRYPMPGDTSCLKYYYCFKLSSGNFSQTLYECASGLFNGATQSCDKTYVCPCSNSSTSAPPDTTSAMTGTTEYTTSGGSTGTTPVYCDAKNASNNFTCLANGRYPMPGDTSCLKYYYCFKLSSGNFSQTLYECANGLFNGATQSCDKTYVCPCNNSSTSAPSDTTSAMTGTTESTTPGRPTDTTPVYCDASSANNPFTCLANGRYPMPGDTTCLKYYYCYKLSSGNFSQTLYECANGLFNEATQSCSKTYICPCHTSSTSNAADTTSTTASSTGQSSTTSAPIIPTTLSTTFATDSTIPGGSTGTTPVYCDTKNANNTFTCSANGRYPMPGDTSCRKYYYCFKLLSGRFSQTLYKCVIGLFNEATQSCDKRFKCPCDISPTSGDTDTTSVITSTVTTSTPRTFSTNTTTESTTPGGSTGTIPAYCDAGNVNNTFTCSANGRYPMPGDTSCRKYYYCFKRLNGRFSQTLYKCVIGLFNESTQSCDRKYVCPCSGDSTVTTRNRPW